MSSKKKYKTRTQEDIIMGRKRQGRLGQCDKCGHMGLENYDCKQCGGNMSEIDDYNDIEIDILGVGAEDYLLCMRCNNVKVTDGTEDTNCSKCIEFGLNKKMVAPDRQNIQKLKNQKYLPHCAQVPFNYCIECYEFANYFERQLPRKFLMASAILQVTREYAKLVELGYKVYLDENQKFKSKLLFERTSLDISPLKLRNLIQHHDKFCLCSICKFWIIANVKQTEL